jgi:hypothetical protein
LTVHSLLLFSVGNIAFHEYPSRNHVGHFMIWGIKSIGDVGTDILGDEINKVFPMATQLH